MEDNHVNEIEVIRYCEENKIDDRYKYHFVIQNPDVRNPFKYSIKESHLNNLIYAILDQINTLFKSFCISLIKADSTYEYCVQNQKQRMIQIYFSKFYYDYCILFLYSIFEYIAKYILVKYDIEKKEMNANDDINGSLFSRFLTYYKKNQIRLSEIDEIKSFMEECQNYEKALQNILKYRNNFIHNDLPIVEGYGIQFSIVESEKKSKDKSIGIGGSVIDKKNYFIFEDLIRDIKIGYKIIYTFTDTCFKLYKTPEDKKDG